MVIQKVTFELRDNVPPEVGSLIPGKFDRRYFGFSDACDIEQSIARFLAPKYSPEEDIKFDLIIYGKLNEALLTVITLDLRLWVMIHGLVYIKPGDEPVRLLPRDSGFVWNGYED